MADHIHIKVGADTSALGNIKRDLQGVRSSFAGLSSAMGALGAGAALGTIASQIAKVVEMGGRFKDLSAQTGESVSELVVLSNAFENAGISAEKVGPSINRLQKALAGVNEDGESTADIFAKLGISANSLKSLGAADQMQAVGKAIAAIPDPSERAAAAMAIFGKSGGEMLALFRDTGAIDGAREAVGQFGKDLQENVDALDAMGDAWVNLKSKMAEGALSIGKTLVLPFFDQGAAAGTRRGQEIDEAGSTLKAAQALKTEKERATLLETISAKQASIEKQKQTARGEEYAHLSKMLNLYEQIANAAANTAVSPDGTKDTMSDSDMEQLQKAKQSLRKLQYQQADDDTKQAMLQEDLAGSAGILSHYTGKRDIGKSLEVAPSVATDLFRYGNEKGANEVLKAAEETLKIQGQIAELEKKSTEESEKKAKQEQEALDRKTEILDTLKLETEIAQAQAAGDQEKVLSLERQLKIQREIQTLTKAGITDLEQARGLAEAIADAEYRQAKNALLKSQAAEAKSKLDEANQAALDYSTASLRGTAAEREQGNKAYRIEDLFKSFWRAKDEGDNTGILSAAAAIQREINSAPDLETDLGKAGSTAKRNILEQGGSTADANAAQRQAISNAAQAKRTLALQSSRILREGDTDSYLTASAQLREQINAELDRTKNFGTNEYDAFRGMRANLDDAQKTGQTAQQNNPAEQLGARLDQLQKAIADLAAKIPAAVAN